MAGWNEINMPVYVKHNKNKKFKSFNLSTERNDGKLTCKKLESSWHTPSLCNPENIRFLSHVQPQINGDRLCPLKP